MPLLSLVRSGSYGAGNALGPGGAAQPTGGDSHQGSGKDNEGLGDQIGL